ncbi:hypothetical protein BJ165DRAFT_1525368 [Panaeolus papilionaceus]|nr:hypothetical protein BJ165DRAFT_1525368 [Panaeolus papilionaceus]
MNRFYNISEAYSKLSAVVEKDEGLLDEIPRLDELQMKGLDVQKYNQSYRLVKKLETDEEGMEEVTVRVPGVICRKMLPPVTRTIAGGPKVWKQYVQLTGLGHPKYNAMVQRIDQVVGKFKEKMAPLNIRAWDKVQYEGQLALDMHSRYFTRRQDDPAGIHETFSESVDPLHILEDSRGADFISTSENKVQYCSKEGRPNGQIRYSKCNPGDFMEGDLVEADVAFACFRVQQNEYRLYLIIRILAKISSELRLQAQEKMKEENQRRAGRAQAEQKKGPVLKRRFVECESDMEVEEEELARMKAMKI